MPTIRGLVFAAVNSALLATGLVRNELGIVVWAGGMILLEAVILVAAAFGAARLRAVRGRFVASLDVPVTDAGTRVGVTAMVPRVGVMPGFVLTHVMHLAGTGGRVVRGEYRVRPNRSEHWHLRSDERGAYRADGSELLLGDLFGFTRSRVRDDTPLRLLVLPLRIEERPSLPTCRGGERAAERSEIRVRSEELREVRPYVPGDDVRRVSWKHLAAHNEILVRIGEFVPPSRSEVRCRVDDHVPSRVSPLVTGDRLMEALRALVHEASSKGAVLHCLFPDESAPVLIDEDVFTGEAATDARRAPALLAGFVPANRSHPYAASGLPGTNLLVTARPLGSAHLPGGGSPVISVAHLVYQRDDPPALWRRILVREDA